MEESILKSTKKMLGIGDDDTTFDHDILTHINAAFSHLQQLGIGPEAGYTIINDTPKWEDYLPDADVNIVNAAKVNIFLQVRLLFDPPTVSYVLTAMQNQLEQSDWRLNVLREGTAWTNPDPAAVIDDDILDGGLV